MISSFAAFAAIYFFRARLDGAKEVKLVVWYAIWLFLTRLFNTDLYLQTKGSSYIYAVVTDQEPAAGTEVPRGTTVTVELTDQTALD